MNLAPHLPLILDLALKSTAILLLAGGLAWVLRGTSAARRHLIWLAAFIALALLPLTLVIPPRWSWSWKTLAPTQPASRTVLKVNPESSPGSLPKIPSRSNFARLLPEWPVIVGSAWLVGMIILLLRQALGFRKLRGLRARSSEIASGRIHASAKTIGYGENVEIRRSEECAVPLTWGLRRPVVMLPATSDESSDSDLHAALTHEFGHIVRRDFVWRQLAQIVRAFYWPNPLVWPALRAMHRVQEEACDDLVLQHGALPAAYARQLVEAARSVSDSSFDSVPAVAMAMPSTLETRVLAILDIRRDRRASSPATRVAAATGLIGVLAASAFAQVKTPPPENAAVWDVGVAESQVEPQASDKPHPSAPYGKWAPGILGYAISPFAPDAGFIDVRGFPSGTEVRDPYTQKIFLVPKAQDAPAPDESDQAKAARTIWKIDVHDPDADAAATARLRRIMTTRVGQPYDERTVEDDIRKLHATGEIFNVRIFGGPTPDGMKVIVVVQRKAPPAAEIKANSKSTEGDVVIAKGNVEFRDTNATITGDALRYDRKTRELEMTGSVRVEQEFTVTTAPKIFYSGVSGSLRMEPSGRTILKDGKSRQK